MTGRLMWGMAVVSAVLFVASPDAHAQKKFAPALPRDGAIKLQETEFLTFWEVLHDKGKPSAMYETGWIN